MADLGILFGSHQVGAMIREGKTSQITSLIQTGKKQGMVSMDQSIAEIFESGGVTADAALDKAIDKVFMRKVVGLESEDTKS